MITFLYSIIIFIACTVGATVGIGGGVIIKPLLDTFGYHSVEVVGFISTCAVFAMSISSSVKYIKAKTEINPKIVLMISLGSVAGGIIGNEIFDIAVANIDSNLVKSIQAAIIAAFIIFVLIYVNSKNAKSFKIKNPAAIITAGLFMGILSAFLGIGGGPINTTFLILLFSFTLKESAVYSVASIFFSQLSQLITIFINNQFGPYTEYYPIIIAAMAISVIGGIIGSKLNRKFSNKTITVIYSVVLSAVAVINVYNVINGFTGG